MVSIIMPAYNCEKYIYESVKSVLNQTYTDWELIIIDDCSNDSTWSIIESINDSRVRKYKNDTNRGIAYTRNRGIELSNGEYIALLDDDDIYFSTKLERQVDYLEAHQDVDIVGSKVQWIDEKGVVISEPTNVLFSPDEIRAQSLMENPFCNCEVLFRKRMIDEYGIRYEDGMFGLEDYHFWVRCLVNCKASNIDECLFYHRIFSDSETSKVARKNIVEKECTYNKIRKLAFDLNGIDITEHQVEELNKKYGVWGDIPFKNLGEFKHFYYIMNEIIKRNSDEISTNYLSFIFRKKINSALLWSNELWWKNESNC